MPLRPQQNASLINPRVCCDQRRKGCCAEGYNGQAPLDLLGDAGSAFALAAPIVSTGAVHAAPAGNILSRAVPAAAGSGPQRAAAGRAGVTDDVTEDLDDAPAEGGGGGGGAAPVSHGLLHLDFGAVRSLARSDRGCQSCCLSMMMIDGVAR